MSGTELRLRGGTTAEVAAFTPALKEVVVDTTAKTLMVGDGVTLGGNGLARSDLSNVDAATGRSALGGTTTGSALFTTASAAAARTTLSVPSIANIQDSALVWGGTAGGTANARTLTPATAITAYAAGQMFRFINGAAANTSTTPTLAISGLTAKTITDRNGSALQVGALGASAVAEVVYDGTNFRLLSAALNEPIAWAIVDGTGTAAISNDFGFASLSDNSTGDQTLTLDTTMSGSNCAVVVTPLGSFGAGNNMRVAWVASVSTTQIRIRTGSTDTNGQIVMEDLKYSLVVYNS